MGLIEMSMYRVLIVDDEREAVDALARMVSVSPFADRLELVGEREGEVPTPDALGGGVDILLMDIQLGDAVPTGIELVDALISRASDVQVIYVSGYLEFAPEAYHTRHTWFLAKPVRQDALNSALERALANLDRSRRKTLLVRSGSSLVQVSPSKVLYVESDRRKVRIHEGERVVETYAKIDDVQRNLPDQFERCHKSFLVNMDCIVEVGTTDVSLVNGETIPVSQRRRRALCDRLVEYVGRMV